MWRRPPRNGPFPKCAVRLDILRHNHSAREHRTKSIDAFSNSFVLLLKVKREKAQVICIPGNEKLNRLIADILQKQDYVYYY